MRRWPPAVVGVWAGVMVVVAGVWPWHTREPHRSQLNQLVLRELVQARTRANGPCSGYYPPSSGGPPLLGVARPQQTPRRRARRLRVWWPRGGATAAVLSRAAAVWRRLDRRAPSMRARPPLPAPPYIPRPPALPAILTAPRLHVPPHQATASTAAPRTNPSANPSAKPSAKPSAEPGPASRPTDHLTKWLIAMLSVVATAPRARAVLLAFLCRSHMHWLYPSQQSAAQRPATAVQAMGTEVRRGPSRPRPRPQTPTLALALPYAHAP